MINKIKAYLAEKRMRRKEMKIKKRNMNMPEHREAIWTNMAIHFAVGGYSIN